MNIAQDEKTISGQKDDPRLKGLDPTENRTVGLKGGQEFLLLVKGCAFCRASIVAGQETISARWSWLPGSAVFFNS